MIFSSQSFEGKLSLIYAHQDSHTIHYQWNTVKKIMHTYLAEASWIHGELHYQIQETMTLRQAMESGLTCAELLRLLRSLRELLDHSDDAMLDPERWLWDPDYWTVDLDCGTMKGVYLPDRRFSSDFASFLGQWAASLVRQSLRESWDDEELILFAHRFYAASTQIEEHKSTVAAFLLGEEERQSKAKPVLLSVAQEEIISDPIINDRGIMQRITHFLTQKRKNFLSRRHKTLPLPLG